MNYRFHNYGQPLTRRIFLADLGMGFTGLALGAMLHRDARANDHLFEQTKQLVLKLLEAQSIDHIVDTFVQGLQNDFKVDFASLVLIGNANAHRGVRDNSGKHQGDPERGEEWPRRCGRY